MSGAQFLLLVAVVVVAPHASPRQATFWGIVLLLGGLVLWGLE
ncbi:hypothetical protein ACMSSJ_11340 [Kerstersia gyiorum]